MRPGGWSFSNLSAWIDMKLRLSYITTAMNALLGREGGKFRVEKTSAKGRILL
jgi:hypothetical protein